MDSIRLTAESNRHALKEIASQTPVKSVFYSAEQLALERILVVVLESLKIGPFMNWLSENLHFY